MHLDVAAASPRALPLIPQSRSRLADVAWKATSIRIGRDCMSSFSGGSLRPPLVSKIHRLISSGVNDIFAEYVISLFAIFLAGILFEGLQSLQQYCDKCMKESSSCCNGAITYYQYTHYPNDILRLCFLDRNRRHPSLSRKSSFVLFCICCVYSPPSCSCW